MARKGRRQSVVDAGARCQSRPAPQSGADNAAAPSGHDACTPLHSLFHFDTPANAAAWRAIDDRVMGGLSRSCPRHDTRGHAAFEGDLALAQGGGFASVRAAVAASPACDLQWLRQVGLVIAVRQAGPFALQLRSIARR